jgi:hypothetical protein
MHSVVLAISLFGFWIGSPSDRQIVHKAEGKVSGQFVATPTYDGVKVFRHGSRWTVCGTANGAHVSGRSGAETFIVDRKSLLFSGDPAFTAKPDDKEAFETLWRTRCIKG